VDRTTFGFMSSSQFREAKISKQKSLVPAEIQELTNNICNSRAVYFDTYFYFVDRKVQ
jgi:hypothetical protein